MNKGECWRGQDRAPQTDKQSAANPKSKVDYWSSLMLLPSLPGGNGAAISHSDISCCGLWKSCLCCCTDHNAAQFSSLNSLTSLTCLSSALCQFTCSAESCCCARFVYVLSLLCQCVGVCVKLLNKNDNNIILWAGLGFKIILFNWRPCN